MRKQKTGTIRVYRSNDYFGVLRKLVIRIDGEKVGSVGINDQFEIDLPSGDYAVTVHMDWCCSQAFEFHLEDGQIIELKSQLNGGMLKAMFNTYFNWHNLFKLVPLNQKSKRKHDDFA